MCAPMHSWSHVRTGSHTRPHGYKDENMMMKMVWGGMSVGWIIMTTAMVMAMVIVMIISPEMIVVGLTVLVGLLLIILVGFGENR